MTTVTAWHYICCNESRGKERLKRKVLRRPWKTDIEGTDVTCCSMLCRVFIYCL